MREDELGNVRSNVNPRMHEKLVALVGVELADKAKIIAESYDGKRGKYVNVYQIPGGVAPASSRKAQAKPFDRPGAGKRLIRIRKAVADGG